MAEQLDQVIADMRAEADLLRRAGHTGQGDHLAAFAARVTEATEDARLVVRFWAKVERTEGCWLWTASLTSQGYGRFRERREMRQAHRVLYEWLYGVPLKGMDVDHTCFTQRCVSPAHLELVTHAENLRRSTQRQTHCKAGHALAGENLRIDKRGQRVCVTCARLASQRFKRRHGLVQEAV